MKVLLINGSPRQKGNTYTALKEIAQQLDKQGEIHSTGTLHTVAKKVSRLRTLKVCRRCARLPTTWHGHSRRCMALKLPTLLIASHGPQCTSSDRQFVAGSFESAWRLEPFVSGKRKSHSGKKKKRT